MTRAFPWGVLGIGPDADERAVRRAYAAQLRAIDPDADHDKFDRLRNARDRALALVRSGASAESQPPEPPLAFDDANRDWLDEEDVNGDNDADDGFRRPAELLSPAIPVEPATTITPVSVDVAASPVSLAPPTLTATEQDRDDTLSLAPPTPPVSDDRLDFGSITVGSGARPSSAPKAPAPPGITAPRIAAPVREMPVMTRSALVMANLGGASGSPTIGDHQEGLIQLLLDVDPDAVATDDEREQISNHLRAILADPSTQNITTAADIERWLAEVFARSTPRSHPWAQWLADHFNWRAEVGTINQSPSIAWMAERAVAFDFRDKVTQPGNKGYKAWQELTTPAQEGSRRGSAKHVNELLRVVRENYPVLEQEFDWHRVSLWERPPSSGGVPWWGIGIGLFVLLRLFASLGSTSDRPADSVYAPPPAVVAPLAPLQGTFDNSINQRDRLIDNALTAIGGAALPTELNPQQRANITMLMLPMLATAQRQGKNESQVQLQIEQALLDRIRGALSQANYTALTDYRRAQAALLRSLATTEPGDCDALLFGERRSNLFAWSDAGLAMQSANAGILRGVGANAPPAPRVRQVNAMQSTFADAARRANMTEAAWRRAFSGNGSSSGDSCIANAALFEAAFDAPTGDEMMRVLRSSL